MGNSVLPFNRIKHHDRSRYSHIDKRANGQQLLEESQVDEWDSSWKDVTHQNIYYRIQYGKFHTFRNDITFEQVQRYRTVLNDKKDFDNWKQMLHWRNNCQYLTKIQHFSLQNKGEMCVSQFQVNLFIERIPLRLADLTDIPFPQNLYFLLCVIKGFKYIFSSPFPIKSFKVTESMICVNKEGQVKVWLNPNLSQFEPINSKQTTYVTEDEILRSMIDLVQQNTDQRDYPYPFRQYLLDNNILINGDYNLIIQQLYTYAKDMKVIIPKYAFSVRDILTKDFFNNTKLDSQNSFSNKPQFKHQNQFQHQNHPLRRDTSLSVINSFDFQPHKKQQVHFEKQSYKGEFFPNQKTHGLISTNKMQTNFNFTTIPQLPTFNGRPHNNGRDKFSRQAQISNEVKSHQVHPEVKQNFEIRHPLTDRNFSNDNINGHFVRINRIGNNIVQFHQPDFSYIQNPLPKFTVQKNQRRQIHSLEKPLTQKHQNSNLPSVPPPGYRMVQRKIIHPINNNLPNYHKPPSFNPSFLHPNPHPQSQHIHHQIPQNPHPQSQHIHHQIPQNHSFSRIQRVNSTRIPFPMTEGPIIPKSYSRSQSIEKTPLMPLTSTKRPEQISNTVNIERISRQSSFKTFSNHESNHENMRKANSFKNNLIKNQHEEKQVQRAVNKLKYFTKKDSQQTLDPQIAGDLMKYLDQQV